MPQLTIHREGTFFREYVFSVTDCLALGRARSNDIVLPDPACRVSRQHAALVRAVRDTECYFIRDLGSLRSTRVSGQPIHQHLLRDGDVVEIAGYELVYSSCEHAIADLSPLRVVSKASAPDGLEQSTLMFTNQEQLKEITLTGDQTEVIESVLQATQHGASGLELLCQMLPGILKAANAQRGFVGLLRGGHAEGFDVLGRTGMSAGDQIEITEAKFMQRLAAGRVVLEQRTVLAPIFRRDAVVGFLGAECSPSAGAFGPEEGPFLVTVCRLIMTRGLNPSPQRIRQDDRRITLEWPPHMVGRSARMQKLRQAIRGAAAGDHNVLLLGESGTGKELAARAIHEGGPHRKGPFLGKNCAAIPETLAEAEIFGDAPHSGIAGADPKGSPGWFEQADGGTLFLDEIQGLSLALQDKFLRILEEREVWRLRARSATSVQVRVVAATDCELEQASVRGAFRKPFLFRFGQHVHLPPIRDRKGDVPLLAFYFLDRCTRNAGSATKTLSHRALQRLLAYDWPGNVRELESCVSSAVSEAVDRDVIFTWDFPEAVRGAAASSSAPAAAAAGITPSAAPPAGPRTMADVEKAKILEALEVTRGNISRAAQLLGYRSRQTLLNKLDRYGIPRSYGDLDAS
ncbi:MAG: sigma 54-interacting transcriptional regulator [Candidatus Eisenbacteria bacterium]|uniref:Sigma 54-interacting transcriptional regulator n=1 Tax=Eiseniibacteriota bacterium TaxID=2212470 RepID=A0A938BLJ7_UNCEI|nr:sigma 54-interacting transcriptional regulator [Candidatus Eisenbacteria bacterium]